MKFLCFVAIVRVRVRVFVLISLFLCFTSLVSGTGSYTEAPRMSPENVDRPGLTGLGL